jgi:2-hydroxychromene-2-carboxylate isomerase
MHGDRRAVAATDRFDAFIEETFRAIWVDRLNLGDPKVAADALVKAGVMPNNSLLWLAILK